MKRKVNIVQDAQSRAARAKQFPRSHPTGDKVVSLMPSLRGLEKWTAEQLQARASVSQDVIPSVMERSEMEYALIEALGSQMEMSDLEDFLAQALTKAECFGIYATKKEAPTQGEK